MANTDLVPVQDTNDYMPIMTIQQAVDRRNMMVEYTRACLIEGHDFGKIPGAGDKPTLLKPGAEKLCTMFGLTPKFEIVNQVEQWTPDDNGELLFYYVYRCSLYRGDKLLANGEGSCNSREKKYRYRKAERVCPQCGAASIIKGKAEYGGGYICFTKKGGCGAKFPDGAQAIEGQEVGQVANPDVADLINTIQKMAQKRAFIQATLIGVNASEFYTQDIEDIPHYEAPQTRQADAESIPEAQPEPAFVDPLIGRRRRALLTFKDHFLPEVLPIPDRAKLDASGAVVTAGAKMHLGKTFANMSEENLEAVEIFMADPNAPVKPKEEPTDAQLVQEAKEHIEGVAA